MTVPVKTLALCLVVACNCGPATPRQSAHPIASQVDVRSLNADAKEALQVWERYLASKWGRWSMAAGTPSELWIESEQQRWPIYDLAAFYLLDNAVPTIRAIDRVSDSSPDAFRITTGFRSPESDTTPPTWWTDMTVTVFVVRDGRQWRLSNALLHNTRAWRRDTVGPITYVYAEDYPYHRARAERAVAFTDSLARAFGVPPIAPLTYFLLPDIDAVYQIMGLESRLKFGATGGAAQPVNRQLFSGIPALGEEYRHELAHLVLAPLLTQDSWYFASEGVPTWIGGTGGADFPTATRALAKILSARPALTLDSVVMRSYPAAIAYPAGAVLTDMIFERGGTEAVKAWLRAGPRLNDVKQTVERLLNRPWPEIVRAWRERVLRVAPPPF